MILSYSALFPNHASLVGTIGTPKIALFRGYKKSRFFFQLSKNFDWPWRALFWAHCHLLYHFRSLWTSTQELIKGNWSKVLLIGNFLKNFFAPVTFSFGPLADSFQQKSLIRKSHVDISTHQQEGVNIDPHGHGPGLHTIHQVFILDTIILLLTWPPHTTLFTPTSTAWACKYITLFIYLQVIKRTHSRGGLKALMYH